MESQVDRYKIIGHFSVLVQSVIGGQTLSGLSKPLMDSKRLHALSLQPRAKKYMPAFEVIEEYFLRKVVICIVRPCREV